MIYTARRAFDVRLPKPRPLIENIQWDLRATTSVPSILQYVERYSYHQSKMWLELDSKCLVLVQLCINISSHAL